MCECVLQSMAQARSQRYESARDFSDNDSGEDEVVTKQQKETGRGRGRGRGRGSSAAGASKGGGATGRGKKSGRGVKASAGECSLPYVVR